MKEYSKRKTKAMPYKYTVTTYNGEAIEQKETYYLSKPYIEAYSNDCPITLGSNQQLLFVE